MSCSCQLTSLVGIHEEGLQQSCAGMANARLDRQLDRHCRSSQTSTCHNHLSTSQSLRPFYGYAGCTLLIQLA